MQRCELYFLVRRDIRNDVERIVFPDLSLKMDPSQLLKDFYTEIFNDLFKIPADEKTNSSHPNNSSAAIIMAYLKPRPRKLEDLDYLIAAELDNFFVSHVNQTITPSSDTNWIVKKSKNRDETYQWEKIIIEYEEKSNCCRVFFKGNMFKYSMLGFMLLAMSVSQYFGFIYNVVLGVPPKMAYAAIATAGVEELAMLGASNIIQTVSNAMRSGPLQNTGDAYQLSEDFKIESRSTGRKAYLAGLTVIVLGIQAINFYVSGYDQYVLQMEIYEEGYAAKLFKTFLDLKSFLIAAKANFFVDISIGAGVVLGMVLSQSQHLEKLILAGVKKCKKNAADDDDSAHEKTHRINYNNRDEKQSVSRLGKFSSPKQTVPSSRAPIPCVTSLPFGETPMHGTASVEVPLLDPQDSPRRKSRCPSFGCTVS